MAEATFSLKNFGKSASLYAIGNICARATAFLLMPLYTHFLSPTEYGFLATLLTAVQVMQMVMDLGAGKGIVRFASEHRIGQLVGSCLVITLANSIVVGSLSLITLVPWLASQRQGVTGEVLLSCASALLLSMYLNTAAYYRVANKPSKYLAVSVSAGAILCICTWCFIVLLHQGVRGAFFGQIVAYASTSIIISLDVHRNSGLGASKAIIRKLLSFGMPLLFVLTGWFLTDLFTLLYLGYFRGLEAVAVYSLGYKLATVASMLVTLPFQLAYEPFVYSCIREPHIRQTISKLLNYLIVCFAVVAFGIAFIARDLLTVIAPAQYSGSYLIILLTLPLIAFNGVSYVGESLLNIRRKTRITGGVLALVTLCAIGWGYLAIPRWGTYGAISTLAVSNIGGATLLMWLGMRNFRIPLDAKRLLGAAALLFWFLSAAFLTSSINRYLHYSIGPAVLCVGFTFLYFAICDIHEQEAMKRFLRGVLNAQT